MRVSIVIAYYNRKSLLIKTLESITNTKFTDFEVVVVDDASRETERIEDLQQIFKFLKVYRVSPKDKWWINPCMPNNIGFCLSSGDIVIIQNPECLHMGDIISNVAENWVDNRYLVYGCYALDNIKTAQVKNLSGSNTTAINNIIQPTNNIPLDQCPYMSRWYQHSIYSPRGLNFCTAIGRDDLNSLGGFDEEFATGISYDDTEFFARIKKKNMNVIMLDNPIVIHQWHPYTDYSNKPLVQRNTDLYFNKTLNNDNFRVNNLKTIQVVEKLQ